MIFGSLGLCIRDYNTGSWRFWDKTTSKETLVIATQGFIKKRSNVPDNEIQKAVQKRAKYFEDKKAKNKKK